MRFISRRRHRLKTAGIKRWSSYRGADTGSKLLGSNNEVHIEAQVQASVFKSMGRISVCSIAYASCLTVVPTAGSEASFSEEEAKALLLERSAGNKNDNDNNKNNDNKNNADPGPSRNVGVLKTAGINDEVRVEAQVQALYSNQWGESVYAPSHMHPGIRSIIQWRGSKSTVGSYSAGATPHKTHRLDRRSLDRFRMRELDCASFENALKDISNRRKRWRFVYWNLIGVLSTVSVWGN